MSHLKNKGPESNASSMSKGNEEYSKFMLEEVERAFSSGNITEQYAKQLRAKYSMNISHNQKERG